MDRITEVVDNVIGDASTHMYEDIQDTMLWRGYGLERSEVFTTPPTSRVEFNLTHTIENRACHGISTMPLYSIPSTELAFPLCTVRT